MRWSYNKFEQWLWYAFLVTAAWQTRAVVSRAVPFDEWTAFAVWASDVFIAALFITALWRGWRPWPRGAAERLLILVLIAATLSLAGAMRPDVGAYQLVRLAEGAVFFLYLRQWAFRRFNVDTSVSAFVAGVLLQAGLGFAQYVLQHDVGIRLAGETILRMDMRGVAVFYDLAHVKILRAYGTLPHPNVLAAYLVAAFWCLAWLYMRHAERVSNAVWAVAGTLILTALATTYSRTIIAAGVLASLGVVVATWSGRISRHWPNIAVIRVRLRRVMALAMAVSLAFIVLQWPRVAARASISAEDEAVTLRVRYMRDALSSGAGLMGRINWSGVGVGNFTMWLADYDRLLPKHLRQPVHNTFLLIYSELGAFGLLVWCAWLGAVVVKIRQSHSSQPFVRVGLAALVGAFLFIALFDHFFWTLQQGRILWWLVLALAIG